MKRPRFITNEIYHIYNRGVEKRNVFISDKDYFRFIHNLFEFNDKAPACNIFYKLPFLNSYEVGLRKNPTRKCVVEILAFCLMPNHFHLMVRQKHSNGITEFMRKLLTSYSKYFNQKYKRTGGLFEGKFKSVHVKDNVQAKYLFSYIHLNPIKLINTNWKIEGIKNWKEAKKFLEKYRWSSYLDYKKIIRLENKILNTKIFPEYFQTMTDFDFEIKDWLTSSEEG
mgnify:CR=1 FL=1